ncbi:MAG: tRNA (adenosine(37)-N6)-threonylcarbamoyltransferase complex dimerization subunit type 1 TsaB [Clostridiales bacterium]|nr:tRNA (adenosine(37)-N6)-threonylcarbamoyltransferase complex dimerization subunit type 1 TsaB [Clostridiales bacterium]
MRILALESSAKAASAAVSDDGMLIAFNYLNNGLTHSTTLLPLAEKALDSCGMSAADADLIAVARGPGSFTGVRIGVAAAKGLMWAAQKPCCGVSTLEAMAWQAVHMEDYLICCVMDARRGQFYNALFTAENGRPSRRCPDRAIDVPTLASELKNCEKPLIVIGDGARLCYNKLTAEGIVCRVAPENIRWQSAYGVALAAAAAPTELWGEPEPVYMRLSQAERERAEKEAAKAGRDR